MMVSSKSKSGLDVACLLACLLSLTSFFSTNACAEGYYVALQLGGNVPNKLTDIKGTVSGITVVTGSDLELKTSSLYGAKLGSFFCRSCMMGFETEVYTSTPNIKQQVVAGTPIPEFDLRVTTWAFNLIFRYPGYNFQPYAGVGLGLFFASPGSALGLKSDNWRPGLNVLAGVRYFLTQNIGLFGEYKYNSVDFKFDVQGFPGTQFQANYKANIFAGGISFHF
jgi:opacity protein-like surface antigen